MLFTVLRWFKHLCSHYGVSGQAYYFYKPVGKGKTFGLKPELALEKLKEGLRDTSMAFIYHCLNHYFCPIGFEEVPGSPPEAYQYVLIMLMCTFIHRALCHNYVLGVL